MGAQSSFRLNFTTQEGADFEEELKFVYARSWMLHEFPEDRSDAGADWSQVKVVAKQEFAYDLRSDNFNLESLPEGMSVKQGDLIRIVIRENPTTGFWWHHNALKNQGAAIREVYNGFQAPDLRLIGASGMRILVFEVNDPTAELRLGLTRPGDEEDLEWDSTNEDELDDHMFKKVIKFMPPATIGDEIEASIFQ